MIPFAMGLFSPVGFSLAPMWSGMVMSLSSVSVVVNSLMLKRYKRPGSFGGDSSSSSSSSSSTALLGRSGVGGGSSSSSYVPLVGVDED